MLKRTIFFIFFIYFLILIQSSFLVHFQVFLIIPNLVLITVAIINLVEKPENKLGVIVALFGGLYLDVFNLSSDWFFGFYLLIALIISFFIKFIFKKYVQIPFFDKI